jgi:hypothetical protein
MQMRTFTSMVAMHKHTDRLTVRGAVAIQQPQALPNPRWRSYKELRRFNDSGAAPPG